MSRIFARIQDGIVAELLQSDDALTGRFHPALVWVEVTGLPVQAGWLEGSGGFTPPPPPPPATPPSLAALQTQLAALAAQIAALTPHT
jgi:hypothetical protein